MKIHEFQAKQLLGAYNIPIPKGYVITSSEEIPKAVENVGGFPVVVKAQIHAGAIGNCGGIKIVNNLDEAQNATSGLLGKRLVTPQTGEEGKPVNHLLFEEALQVSKELYLGITVDRVNACVSLLASVEGGMEIERIAVESPKKLFKENIDPGIGLRPFHANRICFSLGLDVSLLRKMSGIILSLYRLFIDKDCSLAEINPLVITEKGDVVALDAKINIDDNALYRHSDFQSLRDMDQENPLEVEASKYNLNYIKLKGNVGCMVNGAGLAMATMDLIKHVGASPANFLDVGGGATSQMIAEGLKILLFDVDVKVIFINIFGGILRCDTLAKGVVEAARQLDIKLPMVIRLEGTNVETGRRIFAESGLSFAVANGMGDAAKKVAEALNE